MGYDLHAVRPTPAMQALEDQAKVYEDTGEYGEKWLAIVSEKSDLEAAAHLYWRESVWSMTNFRAVIDHIGMLGDDEPAPHTPDESSGTELIPVNRLGSNDGWLIDEHQCARVAAGLKSRLTDRFEALRLIKVYTDGYEGAGRQGWENNAMATLLDGFTAAGYKVATSLEDGAINDDTTYTYDRLIRMGKFFDACSTAGGCHVW